MVQECHKFLQIIRHLRATGRLFILFTKKKPEQKNTLKIHIEGTLPFSGTVQSVIQIVKKEQLFILQGFGFKMNSRQAAAE